MLKIDKKTICNFSDTFDSLKEKIVGCDYSIFFQAKTFTYSEGTIFSFENMKELYPDDFTKGKFNEIFFEDAENYIDDSVNYLSYDKFKQINLAKDPAKFKNDLINEWQNSFWETASSLIKLPPECVYKYEPYDGLFTGNAMWGFCYIFLNNGKGLLIGGGASG
ncbi:TPA: hypothetical protein DEO28_01750 [Candidatus Dependentiae bacterium]|nr:MAG: hypothetical protein UR14_C0004G0040 [candidate division TM6 bacterium GW2011_GWE2_31_21]KKP52958.1 MAG: hypothetical protein UR43_C0008G0040 [candidate division TM6 bacterium GW2011_GWF2_33_332]HBS47804.1 hypothetical protein [Candidatus Dependentiae bacterium]HBZ73220.1 hypothetical protein [Candidatus Dependentiae bacterium]